MKNFIKQILADIFGKMLAIIIILIIIGFIDSISPNTMNAIFLLLLEGVKFIIPFWWDFFEKIFEIRKNIFQIPTFDKGWNKIFLKNKEK